MVYHDIDINVPRKRVLGQSLVFHFVFLDFSFEVGDHMFGDPEVRSSAPPPDGTSTRQNALPGAGLPPVAPPEP